MPWSPSDAHRFHDGLSDKQARQWAHIANSALSSCMEDGGSTDKCEARAIRQANGVVGKSIEEMTEEEKKKMEDEMDDEDEQEESELDDNKKEVDPSFLDKVVLVIEKTIKNILGNHGGQSEAVWNSRNSGVWLFKDQGGTLNWVARYSNNIRDDDWPVQEIISSESHSKFNILVNAGVVPPPELWIWHEPKLRVGKGTWHAYDDTGFPLAGGTVFKWAEDIVERLAQRDDVRLSHGMPVWSISRDAIDKSIITEHVTEEVSLLPEWAAANKYTSFVTLKENEMAFSADDKKRLLDEHPEMKGLLDKIEAMNVADAVEAAGTGKDSKEVGSAVETTQVEQVATTQVVESGNDEVIKAIKETMEMVTVLASRVNALTDDIVALKASDAEKVAQKARESSYASISDLMRKTVVGDEANRVDGRTALAKSTPPEAEVTVERPVLGVPTFLDQWVRPQPAKGGG